MSKLHASLGAIRSNVVLTAFYLDGYKRWKYMHVVFTMEKLELEKKMPTENTTNIIMKKKYYIFVQWAQTKHG